MRYLAPFILKDLKKKMVILAGPRQCGKTTLAKSLLDSDGVYLNWDIQKHRQIIRSQSWPKEASLLVLDELHKMPKWKNALKGISDEFANTPPVLVTGSARLDAFRRAGDALTGRQFFYRLHPIDVSESKFFLPKLNSTERVKRLLRAGGFPEAFLNPKEAERLRNDRMELVVREDLSDLSRVTSWRGPSDLLELLRERVGKPLNYDSLARDLSISSPTLKTWIELLEKLYLIFLLTPYSGNIARGIRKEKRAFFFDCSSAYGDDEGARLENLVACCLLKFVQFKNDTTGEKWDLHYLRDKEKREVDFVITHNRKVDRLIEVKVSDSAISSGLKYYADRLRPREAIQLVLNLDTPQEKSGVKILPLAKWLDDLQG